ncbi:hypothetical protein MBLNU230_g1881t1 [Neophaeotheca triangularis]
MAAAAVARPPSQGAPRRRESQRPAQRNVMEESASKKRKLDEPHVRDSAYILKKHAGKPPSLTIHLHPTHFRFEGQDGSFAYDSPVKAILQHLRSQTVPHEMLEELLQQNVPFYDGCLIVQVYNHRSAGAKVTNKGGAADTEDGVRFSMNNYNEHITPSPFAPYPKKAAETSPKPSTKPEESTNGEMAAPEKPNKDKEEGGPKLTTIVLHPTQLTMHYEMLLLAETPASDASRKGGEADTNGQPPTPRLSVPPTPTTTTRGLVNEPRKMMVDESNMYEFEAELLVATQPPLMLEPARSFEESQRMLEMMAHPLHSGKPPSPKTRKRTTAEMAADDAQAAEAERRMLIMDERIKPSGRTGAGTATNDNQGAAASLSFSRFKTLEMVRQKHEENERVKKEEEARLAVEKKQYEEQMQRDKLTQQNEQRKLMAQQQQQAQLAQRQNQMMQQKQNAERAQQIAAAQQHQQQQQLLAQQQAQQNQGHAQQGFQHPGSAAQQSSPPPRQQTPMMNSSPMMNNGGFPMVPTSSQGAGSPARATSAAIPQHVAMARNQSQQQGSRNNTPQVSQGTPNMTQAMPNRQSSQTPRMPHGSPAPGMQDGTPSAMSMATPQFNNQGQQLTPEQMMLLNQRNQQNLQHAGIQGSAGSPQTQMTPEQFQQASQAQASMQNERQRIMGMRENYLRQAQIAINNQNQALAQQHHTNAQRCVQMLTNSSRQFQAGSPMNPQTPNMGHSHPGQQQQQHNMNNMQQQPQTPQGGGGNDPNMLAHQQSMQRQNMIHQQQQAQIKLKQIAHAHGGYQNIPPQMIQSMPPVMQNMLRRQQAAQAAQMQQRAQQMAAMRQQQGGMNDPSNPSQYMQNLRQQQAMLAGQMQGMGNGGNNGGNGVQGGGAGSPGAMPAMTPGGMNPMQMSGGMMNQQQYAAAMQHQQNQQGGGGQQQQQGSGGGDGLNAQFAAMQNALANNPQARAQ